jgi:hypothetical protein
MSSIPQKEKNVNACNMLWELLLIIRGDNFMKQKSMIAFKNLFLRLYCSVQNQEKLFDDYLPKDI